MSELRNDRHRVHQKLRVRGRCSASDRRSLDRNIKNKQKCPNVPEQAGDLECDEE